MFHTKEVIDIPGDLLPDAMKPDDLVFFDIETTGFSPEVTTLTIIGMIYRDSGVWYLDQMLCDIETDESLLLKEFCKICRQKRTLVHFNGRKFDVPYLQKKCDEYEIPATFASMDQIDLWTRYKSLKTLLQLPDTKQKSFEQFLFIRRKDTLSGNDLIPLFHKYVQDQEEKYRTPMILHNREDVLGLVKLLYLEGYLHLCRGDFKISRFTFSRPVDHRFEFVVTLILDRTLVLPISCELPQEGWITAKGGVCQLLIYGYYGKLKHFLENYEKYYYLPKEDIAIHKSVAGFVDPSHREQAKASNCYTQKKGYFLPQKSIFYTPTFRKEYRDSVIWFECNDKFGSDRPKMESYIRDFFFGKEFRE